MQERPFLWTILSSMLEVSSHSRGSQCMNDTGRAILGVLEGELYGLLMLDAMGKPGPGILRGNINMPGSYKLCRYISVTKPQGL